MASAPPAVRRRVIAWSTFVLGVATLIPLVALDSTSCSEQHPCGPTPIYAAASGIFIVSWFLGFIRPWAAAAASSVATLAVALQGHGAVELVMGGYALVTIALAWLAVRRPDTIAWATHAGYAKPVVPAGWRPRASLIARIAQWTGTLTLLMAAGVSVLGLHRQAAVDEQTRRAEVVTATVTQRVDDFTIKVAMPGGSTSTLDVVDSLNYEPGQQVRIALDDRGLKQLLSEPNDASGWQALAGGLAALGAALWLSGSARARRRRSLLRDEQPVSAIVLWHGFLYPGTGQMGELPFAGLTAVDHVGGIADTEAPSTLDLYGVPHLGAECILAKPDGSFAALIRLRNPSSGPPLVGDIALPQRDIIPEPELTSAPETLHQHRKPAWLGLLLTMAMPFAIIEALRWIGSKPSLLWPIAFAISGLCSYVGWRLWLRPAIAWNGGGVAVLGILGKHRHPWPEIARITIDGDIVVLTTTSGTGIVVPAQTRYAGRTAASLRSGLEHARSRYAPGVSPPGLPKSWSPLILLALWPVVGIAVAAFATFAAR